MKRPRRAERIAAKAEARRLRAVAHAEAGDPSPDRIESLAALLGGKAAGHVLVIGRESAGLADAAKALSPTSVAVLADPTPEALTALHGVKAGRRRSAGYDTVVIGGGLDRGPAHLARERLAALPGLLAPGGRVLMAVETFAYAAPLPGVGAYDALLFPERARAGALGTGHVERTPVPASGWLLLLQGAGIAVDAVQGHGDQPLPDDLIARHAERLEVFDPGEVASGLILVGGRAMEKAA